MLAAAAAIHHGRDIHDSTFPSVLPLSNTLFLSSPLTKLKPVPSPYSPLFHHPLLPSANSEKDGEASELDLIRRCEALDVNVDLLVSMKSVR
jgi:hypothetical protein